jgi:small nuclear ribonucleoprotein (snRNP)-like protein
MQRDVKGQMAQIDRHKNMVLKNCVAWIVLKFLGEFFANILPTKQFWPIQRIFCEKDQNWHDFELFFQIGIYSNMWTIITQGSFLLLKTIQGL